MMRHFDWPVFKRNRKFWTFPRIEVCSLKLKFEKCFPLDYIYKFMSWVQIWAMEKMWWYWGTCWKTHWDKIWDMSTFIFWGLPFFAQYTYWWSPLEQRNKIGKEKKKHRVNIWNSCEYKKSIVGQWWPILKVINVSKEDSWIYWKHMRRNSSSSTPKDMELPKESTSFFSICSHQLPNLFSSS
jgi:hypothetical protein